MKVGMKGAPRPSSDSEFYLEIGTSSFLEVVHDVLVLVESDALEFGTPTSSPGPPSSFLPMFSSRSSGQLTYHLDHTYHTAPSSSSSSMPGPCFHNSIPRHPPIHPFTKPAVTYGIYHRKFASQPDGTQRGYHTNPNAVCIASCGVVLVVCGSWFAALDGVDLRARIISHRIASPCEVCKGRRSGGNFGTADIFDFPRDFAVVFTVAIRYRA